MHNLGHDFIRFAIDADILTFGAFTTKAKRTSPYFFNAGQFNRGTLLGQLGEFYAQTLLQSGLACDMLFGPAYKGIPLVAATAIALARHGVDMPFAFNRKEAKHHGEGGVMIGAPIAGRVLIVDDVISAGVSVLESLQMIEAAGGKPCGVLIALDRMERMVAPDGEELHTSAVQHVNHTFGLPVLSIARLTDLLEYLRQSDSTQLMQHQEAIAEYRRRYGID